ncbi:pantetheine-phosphate adenylyltransferase [Desulfovermiculus halophilus]|jgi:pantetheine-phosphate adenylyltransferase|uniref:pantetheine-phosphate adenylyltransferase n=1 Tax=Desulfovermiculus halophilus TaxID=339722 RepID=UPI000484C05F|nr:pantetheine-phosphate adenylyltransferase [Desulfovermiculus halophilus]
MESPKPKTAVYPGTFDPLTNGHVSIVRRGLDVFDTIVLAIAKDTPKQPLFPLEERVVMAEEVFAHFPQVVVEPFSGLLVEYVDNRGAQVVLRGLRAISDFEYEFQMALMNRRLKRDVHTLFMMTDYKWLFTSSSIIKETVSLGGDVQGLVPEPVWLRLRKKYAVQ